MRQKCYNSQEDSHDRRKNQAPLPVVQSGHPLSVRYHDEEWGVLCHDDHALYELLILETFQAGLSWETVLNKRQRFRKVYR